jgi:hypothetical protein
MNKWYSGESTVNPALIDAASSKRYVYVRRNVEQHERIDEMTGETVTYYTFEEMKIPRDAYDIFAKTNTLENEILDTQEALTTIYEMITEE